MKKYLMIIPFILLLGTGCQSLNSANVRTNREFSSNVNTVDWRSYSSEEHGFSFKYPRNIRFDTPNVEPISLDVESNTMLLTATEGSASVVAFNVFIVDKNELAVVDTIVNADKVFSSVSTNENLILNHSTATHIQGKSLKGGIIHVYVASLSDEKSLVFVGRVDSIETVNTLEVDLKSDISLNTNTTESGNERNLSPLTKCFDFIFSGEFIDPNPWFYLSHMEPLQSFAEAWEWGKICSNEHDNFPLYAIYVSREDTDLTDDQLFEKTFSIYQTSPDPYLTEYRSEDALYVLAGQNLNITTASGTLQLDAGEIKLVTELSWTSALSGCSIQEFINQDGKIVVSCGQGDNGCYETSRVQWDIITNKPTYLNQCTKNCDLPANEPVILKCI